eukprot:1145181-Pelagomonas_calceolata.AAC.7
MVLSCAKTPQEETLHMSGNTNATSSMHVKTRHCVKVDVEIEARTQNVAMERKDVAGNAAPCAITGGEYKACEDHALKLVHPADSHGLGQPYVQESQITRLANATDYVTPHTTTGGNGKPIGHASNQASGGHIQAANSEQARGEEVLVKQASSTACSSDILKHIKA